jgi:type VI secretion system protein ImpI
MSIRLRLENVDRLSNGGPTSFSSSGRGFEIGREGRDWNLPDAEMFISGRHCEIRYDNGGYWLHDVSRNGTFINGSRQRVGAPHHLVDGDRLKIGRYVICVSVDHEERRQAEPQRLGADPFFSTSADARLAQIDHSGRRFDGRQQDRPPADAALIRQIATSAGLPPDAFEHRDEREVAREIGAVLRVVVEETAQLLKARAAAKMLVKSTHRTMVGAMDNNPLKFLPGAEEILEAMLARRRQGYMDAKHSFEDAFRDLKAHEIATYAAMQTALGRLLDDMSPEAVEKKVPASVFSSRKAQAWDTFVTIWQAKEAAHDNGMLDVFLAYFSEAYAKAVKPK